MNLSIKNRLKYEVPWPEFIETLEKLLGKTLCGMPLTPSVFTVRKKYNYYLGEWEKVEPEWGPGIKAVIDAIFDELEMHPEIDYKIFSLESEGDMILHIVFITVMGESTDIILDMLAMQI